MLSLLYSTWNPEELKIAASKSTSTQVEILKGYHSKFILKMAQLFNGSSCKDFYLCNSRFGLVIQLF